MAEFRHLALGGGPDSIAVPAIVPGHVLLQATGHVVGAASVVGIFAI